MSGEMGVGTVSLEFTKLVTNTEIHVPFQASNSRGALFLFVISEVLCLLVRPSFRMHTFTKYSTYFNT